MRTPLPWLQLFHKPFRVLAAVAGIAFADILIFMQLGFRDALLESATQIHQKLNADLILIHPQSEAIHILKSFSRRRLTQVLSLEEVDSVAPLYAGVGAQWKNPETHLKRALMVIAFNPSKPIFKASDINQNIDKIQLSGIVLFDTESRPEFGPVVAEFKQGKIIQTEVNGSQVRVGGLFALGPSFAFDGTIVASDLTFTRIFPEKQSQEIQVGLIRLKPGSNIRSTQAALQRQLPDDVKVLSHEDFVDFEKNYWITRTPIGFIFILGTIMGIIVGIVIVYQILSSDVSDHLPEYATLKAMGYTHQYLLAVVFQEALILAILGYIPGLAISLGLYSLTHLGTKLPMAMHLSRIVTVLILTALMCFGSGALTVNRLRDADPADIF